MHKNIVDVISNFIPVKKDGKKVVLADWLKTAAIFILTVFAAEVLYYFHFGIQIVIMVYVLSILIVSRITSGYIYGMTAAILNTFIYDFLITEPRMGFSFTIGFPITLFTMLLVVIITCALTTQLKNQAKIAIEREQNAQLLYEINQKLLLARDTETIVKLTNEYIISHMKHSAVFYTGDPLLTNNNMLTQSHLECADILIFYSDDERQAAHDIYINSYATDTLTYRGNGVYYAPIISKNRTLGLIGIFCGGGTLNQHELLFVKTLIGQVALALEVQYISDEQKRILIDTEREKMRSTLLRAISHDLRTPLTTILGASSTILEQKSNLNNETSDKLIMNIQENAQWLIRIVENLLSVTKISQDTMKLKKTLEAAEEVVAQSVSIVRNRFPDRHIHIRIPDELLLVPMEATLISQVIINLIENSIKNSPNDSLILLDLRKQNEYAEFSVSDEGSGIPAQLMGNLFEIHSMIKEQSVDSVNGMGIGLSICKTIIQAHGGTITGKNKSGGGAYFSFSIPLKE